MKSETKTRQVDQLLGILPSKEDLLDFGMCSVCMLGALTVTMGPIFLIAWLTGNL
jgi:hypothetical protein